MTGVAQQVPLFGLQAWHWQQALHALLPGGQCLDPRLTTGDLKSLYLQVWLLLIHIATIVHVQMCARTAHSRHGCADPSH